MCHAALGGVNRCAAEILLAYILSCYSLDHRGACEEHVGETLCHDGEVGQGRAVDGAAGTRPHNGGNLGNHSRRHDVALENLRVAGKGVDTLLDTGTAGVVETDHGSPHLHRHVHNLADLLRHSLGKGASEYCEVLCEHVYQTAFDCTETGHHTVTEDMLLVLAEVCAAVCHKHVELLETTLVEQHRYALAGGVFASLVLFLDGFLATSETALGTLLDQLADFFFLFAHCFMF